MFFSSYLMLALTEDVVAMALAYYKSHQSFDKDKERVAARQAQAPFLSLTCARCTATA